MQLGQIWWHDDKQVQGLFIIKLDYGHLNGDEIKDIQLCLLFVTSINKSDEHKFGQTNIMWMRLICKGKIQRLAIQ
jgi:hypothetical protein